jgi:hypothetical protein
MTTDEAGIIVIDDLRSFVDGPLAEVPITGVT